MEIPFFDEKEIEKVLPDLDVKNALKDMFVGLAAGSSLQPPQTVMLLPHNAGDCIYYPGAILSEDIIGVKVSPYLARLSEIGEYPVTAYTMLVSAQTGNLLLVCDSLLLTTIRTAATTSLALDYLIPEKAEKLALIGAGQTGLHHLKYVSNQHKWHEINVYSPSLADSKAPKHQARKKDLLSVCPTALVVDHPKSAVSEADVVMLCTTIGTPVIEHDWLKEKVAVTSIGTSMPRHHEISPKTLVDFNMFCDYRQTAPLSAGEMVIAKEMHNWDESRIVADLPELVTGIHKGAKQCSGKIFFRSIGLGLEDIAVANLLLKSQ